MVKGEKSHGIFENPAGVCFSRGILSRLPWELNPKNCFRIFLQWDNSLNIKTLVLQLIFI